MKFSLTEDEIINIFVLDISVVSQYSCGYTMTFERVGIMLTFG